MYSRRKPRKKTIDALKYIEENIKLLSRKELISGICSGFGVGKRRATNLIKQFKEEGCEILEKFGRKNAVGFTKVELEEENLPACIPSTTNTLRLPRTEEELKEYRYKYVLSPEARALRIDALIAAIDQESGIARIKALELLDEMTKEFSDTSSEEEPLFFNVFCTENIPDEEEE